MPPAQPTSSLSADLSLLGLSPLGLSLSFFGLADMAAMFFVQWAGVWSVADPHAKKVNFSQGSSYSCAHKMCLDQRVFVFTCSRWTLQMPRAKGSEGCAVKTVAELQLIHLADFEITSSNIVRPFQLKHLQFVEMEYSTYIYIPPPFIKWCSDSENRYAPCQPRSEAPQNSAL